MISLDTNGIVSQCKRTSYTDMNTISSDDRSQNSQEKNDNGLILSDNEDRSKFNPAWAEVMQKILKLNNSKRKKSEVLSKAKKLDAFADQEQLNSFDIQEKNNTVQQKALPKATKNSVKRTLVNRNTSCNRENKIKDDNLSIRFKVLPNDRKRERNLRKTATKGVVQLFNSVRQQQMEITKKLNDVGNLERKKTQVLKNIDKHAFLDILMKDTKKINTTVDASMKEPNDMETNDCGQAWSILGNNFMMSSKLKDWNKTIENNFSSSSSEDSESDTKNRN